MDFLLSRYRNMTALLLVILAQLVLVAWQVKGNQDVRLIRVWAVTAVTPLARVLEFVREHTIGVAEKYFVLINVRSENQQMKDELGRVKMENQFLRNELSTAERVRALQAFQERTPSRTLPARIIGTGTGTNSKVVFIDQGSAKGVMRGMAVVTPDGIVGKVLAAYPTASQVLLVTDETFAAGVISEKNRVHGLVKGIGQSKVLVQYVQNEENVDEGEMFYTAGDDRVFPKGMPVGRVTVTRPGNPFKEIYLVPSGFQQGLEEVLVVIEGVHGEIPDSRTAAAPGVYLMPPTDNPKPAAPPRTAQPEKMTPADGAEAQPALTTEADRLRERYKRLGEAQGHTYGQPTGRIPNFNLDPDAARPQAAPGENRPPAAPATGTAPLTSGARPDTPGLESPRSAETPGTATARPQAGAPATGTAGQQATRVPAQSSGTPTDATTGTASRTPGSGVSVNGTGQPGTSAPRVNAGSPNTRNTAPPAARTAPGTDEPRAVRPQQ